MKVSATRPPNVYTVTLELTDDEVNLLLAQRTALYGGVFGHLDSPPKYK